MPKELNKDAPTWEQFNEMLNRMGEELKVVYSVGFNKPYSIDKYLALKCIQDLDLRLTALENRVLPAAVRKHSR